MTTCVRRDASPVDGCDLVDFTVEAVSVEAAARLARDVPWSRCRTAKKLRMVGNVRAAGSEDSVPDSLQPGVVHWLSDEGWRRVEWGAASQFRFVSP